MRQQDEPHMPLSSGWESLRVKLTENEKRTDIEIEMFRLAFMWGARHAIRTAAHSAMSLPLMALEVREFERTLRTFLQDAAATDRLVRVV